MQKKLTVDQLNIDFYKGTGTVRDIALDCEVSEMAQKNCVKSTHKKEQMIIALLWSPIYISCIYWQSRQEAA